MNFNGSGGSFQEVTQAVLVIGLLVSAIAGVVWVVLR